MVMAVKRVKFKKRTMKSTEGFVSKEDRTTEYIEQEGMGV